MAAFGSAVGALAHLEVKFNAGEYADAGFSASGGHGTRVVVDDDMRGFRVEVHPWRDLWLTEVVVFHVHIPERFPKERPVVTCAACSEAIRSDPRLLMPVAAEDAVAEDAVAEDGPRLYRSRIESDGTVHANLFESQYMGWLEFYDIEVVVHTLRLLFRKSEAELAPEASEPPVQQPLKLLVESGMYEEQGPRKAMEDRVIVEDFRFVAGRQVALHAVLDGHGGDETAELASVLLEGIFFEQLALVGVERALYNAVMATEARLAAKADEERERTGYTINTSGSTLCAVAIDLLRGVAYCANVGDSRAVLCRRDGQAKDLSVDHKASRPDEVARVVHTGGFVSYGRVLGMLAVSRALGDPEMKSPNALVTAVPDIVRVELCRDDEFIVIACDGVFDVMDSQETVHFVRQGLAAGHDVEQVTVDLVHHALDDLGSQDNVSAIVVRIQPQPDMPAVSVPNGATSASASTSSPLSAPASLADNLAGIEPISSPLPSMQSPLPTTKPQQQHSLLEGRVRPRGGWELRRSLSSGSAGLGVPRAARRSMSTSSTASARPLGRSSPTQADSPFMAAATANAAGLGGDAPPSRVSSDVTGAALLSPAVQAAARASRMRKHHTSSGGSAGNGTPL